MAFGKSACKYAKKMADACVRADTIDSAKYVEKNVQRGLRDINGNGVPAGLTNISYIKASRTGENGERIPAEGKLYNLAKTTTSIGATAPHGRG